MSSVQKDAYARLYQELIADNGELFENPPGCPIEILLEEKDIQRAIHDVSAERNAMGWPTDDLRVGVLAGDPYLGHVIRDAVRFVDGKLGLYNRIVTSGGVAILPILPNGSIALIRIFRHPLRRWSIEAPQGFMLPGSIPEEEARRELVEEIGATIEGLISLGDVYTSTGLTSENLKMFGAKISAFGRPQLSEGIESIRVILPSEIDGFVTDGTISDGPTLSLIFQARIRGLL